MFTDYNNVKLLVDERRRGIERDARFIRNSRQRRRSASAGDHRRRWWH